MTVYHLEIEGGFNVRDLGGYPTRDGQVTKHGVLVRAGTLSDITDAAQARLVDYGVKNVIDLRDEWEVQTYPDASARSVVMRYRNLPFIGDRLTQDAAWKAEAEQHETMFELYCYWLEHCQPQIKAIVSAIIDSEPTTLYHCYAGKDRTGIISALILGVVGVPEEVIVQDYAETTARIQHLIAAWRANAILHQEDMSRFERNVGSSAPTMENLLRHISDQYGGATNYLRLCGITDGQLDSLKTRLIG